MSTPGKALGIDNLMEHVEESNIRYIFTEIAGGQGKHGDFLVAFAEAIIRADHENFQLLLPIAKQLIEKYDLLL